MRNRGLASSWYGLCCLLLSLTAGCALPAPRGEAPVAATHDPGNLLFLARATQAEGAEREALWQDLERREKTSDVALRKILLRSLGGHSAYDPAIAMGQLRTVLASDPDQETAALLRIRLAALEAATRCWTEINGLQRRLDAVADIERQMDEGF